MRDPVVVERKVDDLPGLLYALRDASFAVHNVGADAQRTYVWLEDGEDKDPAAVVESWVGKKAPAASDMKAFEARKVTAERVERKAEAGRKVAMGKAAAAEAAKPKPSLISKVFRKLW